MNRRFVVLMGLALCGVLAGCSSSPVVPKHPPSPVVSKHAPGPGPALPITVRAGTVASSSLIEAPVLIDQAGTYQYDLAYAHVPRQPGMQPQACLPLAGFRLTSDSGTVRFLKAAVTGSVELTAGRWTASSGFDTIEQLEAIIPPYPGPDSFWSGACPWSLTLTPLS
jgi:hypothetical protein